jgi:hypothetical protein
MLVSVYRSLPWSERYSQLLLYHLVTAHGLWHAPIYGYLLLVSAWVRRAAILWAALPLLAIRAWEATRRIVVATRSLVLQFGHKLAFQGVHLVGV